MPEKVRPEVAISLDKERHLRFDVNAMVTFEELTGLNLLNPAVQKNLAGDMTVAQFRAFLYSCLIHEDEKLTLKQVGSFITRENMQEIAARLSEAQKLATTGDKEAKETAPLAESPTG